MKKGVIVVFVLLLFLLTSCNSIREYKGTKITKLTYISIDYNGGTTKEKVLDFNENKYFSKWSLPNQEPIPELEVKKVFTDEEEKVFIDSSYSYGLFGLKESYKRIGKVMDGGGWQLVIEYEDGAIKISEGSNAGPSTIFNKCSTCFYDLCGEEVLGSLPSYYIDPPKIDRSLSYSIGNYSYSLYGFPVVRGNYTWNRRESLNNDIFLLNSLMEKINEFESGIVYYFSLGTTNYDCDERFNKITVKKYDYNSELSNEETIYTGKWIKNVKLDLEFNKIYVYELSFKDGDFIQYTFNTYLN